MNLEEYTGDPAQSVSYLYGSHWKGKDGYRVILGTDTYSHRFGGHDWNVPICENCKTPYHQIFTFDLRDPRFNVVEIDKGQKNELPLISCLNCSSSWERQLYKLEYNKKAISVLENKDTQHWVQDDEDKIHVPLPKYDVMLVKLESNENPVDKKLYYEITNSIGSDYICRILGAPVLMQSPIDIECPVCKNDMIYISGIYSQHYSHENMFPDVEFFLGEMSLYYHLCTNCHIMKVECQGT